MAPSRCRQLTPPQDQARTGDRDQAEQRECRPGDARGTRRLAGRRLAGSVLILGVTPELRDLVAEAGARPVIVDSSPAMYEAKILITEMTFVAPGHRKERIHKHGHMHLDDFVERSDRFQNELIIAMHFSTRYHDKQVWHWVERSLPDMLGGRLKLWL